MLNEQNTFPKKINEAVLPTKLLDRLFKRRHLPSLDAENLEKVVVERLGLALFIGGVLPLFCKRSGTSANLVCIQQSCPRIA